jgi:adenine phosphoribosyltransferase
VTAQPVGSGGDAELRERVRAGIRDVADYPSPGILFKDITPLLADSALFADTVTALGAGHESVELVVGIEARGFMFAAPVAVALGAGFVPIRKRGKLPHTTLAEEYALEYGTATIEMHTDAVRPGQRVLLVDDVLATGGTAAAAIKLIEALGGEVVELAFLAELDFLNGREKLPGRPIRSLIRY